MSTKQHKRWIPRYTHSWDFEVATRCKMFLQFTMPQVIPHFFLKKKGAHHDQVWWKPMHTNLHIVWVDLQFDQSVNKNAQNTRLHNIQMSTESYELPYNM